MLYQINTLSVDGRLLAETWRNHYDLTPDGFVGYGSVNKGRLLKAFDAGEVLRVVKAGREDFSGEPTYYVDHEGRVSKVPPWDAPR
ncbi:MAG TPA: hypothetical protein VEA41_22570 [Salinarimonas sp.]|nr:hypothetical protein [Salinarimonas sp.]